MRHDLKVTPVAGGDDVVLSRRRIRASPTLRRWSFRCSSHVRQSPGDQLFEVVSSQLARLAVGVWSVTDGGAGAIKVRVGAIAFAIGKGTAFGVLVATPAKFDALSSLAKCSAESRNRQATTRKGGERERGGNNPP